MFLIRPRRFLIRKFPKIMKGFPMAFRLVMFLVGFRRTLTITVFGSRSFKGGEALISIGGSPWSTVTLRRGGCSESTVLLLSESFHSVVFFLIGEALISIGGSPWSTVTLRRGGCSESTVLLLSESFHSVALNVVDSFYWVIISFRLGSFKGLGTYTVPDPDPGNGALKEWREKRSSIQDLMGMAEESNFSLEGVERDSLEEILIAGFTGQLKGWWDHLLTKLQQLDIFNAIQTDENGAPILDEFNNPIQDAVATLILTISLHFIGDPSHLRDKNAELLHNLRCRKLSDFQEYKTTFFTRLFLRDDANHVTWKEKFLAGLPTLLGEKVRNSIKALYDNRIPYDELTYGELVSFVNKEGLKICQDLKLQKRLKQELRRSKQELGSFCKQFNYDPFKASTSKDCNGKCSSKPYKKHYKSKSHRKPFHDFRKLPYKKPSRPYKKHSFSKKKEFKTKPKTPFNFKDATCFKCGMKGHTVKFCRMNKRLQELDLNEDILSKIAPLLIESSDSESSMSGDNDPLQVDELFDSDTSASSSSNSESDSYLKKINVLTKDQEIFLELVKHISDPNLQKEYLDKLLKTMDSDKAGTSTEISKVPIIKKNSYDLTQILDKKKTKKMVPNIQDLQKEIKEIKCEIRDLKEKQKNDSETIQLLLQKQLQDNSDNESNPDDGDEIKVENIESVPNDFLFALKQITTRKYLIKVTLIFSDDFAMDAIALFDTGADLNCIREEIVPKRFHEKTKECLSAANNSKPNYKDFLSVKNIPCLFLANPAFPKIVETDASDIGYGGLMFKGDRTTSSGAGSDRTIRSGSKVRIKEAIVNITSPYGLDSTLKTLLNVTNLENKMKVALDSNFRLDFLRKIHHILGVNTLTVEVVPVLHPQFQDSSLLQALLTNLGVVLPDELITQLNESAEGNASVGDKLLSGDKLLLENKLLSGNKLLLREILHEVMVRKRFAIKTVYSEPRRFLGTCKNADCPWYVSGAKLNNGTSFTLREYNKKHECRLTNKTVKVTSAWVASKIKGQVVVDPNVKIYILKNHVQETYGLKIGKMTLYRAKVKAKLEVLFHRFFVAFPAQKNAFLNGCRPFIGVDGCHLKGKYGGVLLAVVGMDVMNRAYNPPKRFVVKLESRICDCVYWKIAGLPCPHVMAAMGYARHDVQEYVPTYFSRHAYLSTYSVMFSPLPDQCTWEPTGRSLIDPSIVEKKIGRPKKTRIRVANEPQKEKRKFFVISSFCGGANHNVRSCLLRPSVARENRARSNYFQIPNGPSQSSNAGTRKRRALRGAGTRERQSSPGLNQSQNPSQASIVTGDVWMMVEQVLSLNDVL
ncbi:hypothetical protein KPL71_001059 [Citrus sinensis]|uniref:Uncharacterized protein n=1 Tax=Citrus sinensis TaxID=2711 RepID=A0ACB8NTN4_CITSI|nr:hypothetical protein KPL71_001059 [Citrus sinensis]